MDILSRRELDVEIKNLKREIDDSINQKIATLEIKILDMISIYQKHERRKIKNGVEKNNQSRTN